MNLRKEFESQEFKDILKQKLKEECVNCESKFNIQYHHIIPLSLGGTNKITNIVPLCEHCHNKIHNRKNISFNVFSYLLIYHFFNNWKRCWINWHRIVRII